MKSPVAGAPNDGGGRDAPKPVGREAPKSAGRLKGEDPKSAGRLRGANPKSAGRLGRETGGRAVSRPPKRGNEDRLAPKSAGRVVAGRAAGKDEKALTGVPWRGEGN